MVDPGYTNAHKRVRADKGRARDWACVDCGKGARHWSYDHADPDEFRDERGYAYSADPNHYVPRCVPCHRKYDLGRNAAPTPSPC